MYYRSLNIYKPKINLTFEDISKCTIKVMYNPIPQFLYFPFFRYPNYEVCPYQDVNNYKENVVRLYEEIVKLENTAPKNTVFHLTIGACMEEYMTKFGVNENIKEQWRQLLPHHIQSVTETYKSNIVHFIVAPIKSFSKEFKEPLFVSQTPEYDWHYTNDKGVHTYVSEKNNITVKIFYTMMPSISKMSTANDKRFVREFYKTLEETVKSIKQRNGFCSCFSFAVFRNDSVHSRYNNFGLFTKIKLISFNILGEWDYNNEESHKIKMYKFNNKQCFEENISCSYRHITDKSNSESNVFCLKMNSYEEFVIV